MTVNIFPWKPKTYAFYQPLITNKNFCKPSAAVQNLEPAVNRKLYIWTLCRQFLTEFVVSKIKENQFFSILSEEASGCIYQEQLSLITRYVDSDCVITEDFLAFFHCDLVLVGKALAETVLRWWINLSLDIRYCRGQNYDVTAAVSGHIKGLSAYICNIRSIAIYTHYHSYRLDLVITAY